MRRIVMIPVVFLLAILCAPAAELGSRTMSGWFNVQTPDGWYGKRYMDGNEIFAEEFDSNGDARMDVWRFYRRGVLSSEERDLNYDGKVDFQSRWEPRDRRLMSVLRDTDRRGVNDLEIEATGRMRWEIREDRNHDGVTDRILIVNGPSDLFEQLGMDLSMQRGVIDNIPREYWYELWSDDTFTSSITDYRRYNRGEMTHYGEWDGRKVVWRKVEPGFEPPPPAQPQLAAGNGQTRDPGYPPAPETQPPQYATGPAENWTGEDPNASAYEGGTTGYQDPGQYGTPSAPSDRTRYEGMPPGESAARSVPARMRPPGTSRR